MKLVRATVVSLLIFGLSTPSFAGDLLESAVNAAQQRQVDTPRAIEKGYLWTGGALFVAGMSMTLYGWLHTSGDEFVSGQVSKESKTELGGVGLAMAGAGGAILFLGWQRAKHSPSVAVGPGRLTIVKKLSW